MLSELLIAVIIVLFLMVWVVTVALAFVGGFLYKGRKPLSEPKKPTEADIRKAKRMQKEVENFMTYNGIPQEAINDYDY